MLVQTHNKSLAYNYLQLPYPRLSLVYHRHRHQQNGSHQLLRYRNEDMNPILLGCGKFHLEQVDNKNQQADLPLLYNILLHKKIP